MAAQETVKTTKTFIPVTGQEVADRFAVAFQNGVNVTVARPSTQIEKASDQEGIPRMGRAFIDAEQLFRTVAGTELCPKAFAEWLSYEGFQAATLTSPVSLTEAGTLLLSDESRKDPFPLIRFIRPDTNGKPSVILDIFFGASSKEMMDVISAANGHGDYTDQEALVKLVDPLIFQNTSSVRFGNREWDGTAKFRQFDDHIISGATLIADAVMNKNHGLLSSEHDWLINAGVATPQGLINLITFISSQDMKRTVHLRIGTLAYGITDQFYDGIANVTPQLGHLGPEAIKSLKRTNRPDRNSIRRIVDVQDPEITDLWNSTVFCGEGTGLDRWQGIGEGGKLLLARAHRLFEINISRLGRPDIAVSVIGATKAKLDGKIGILYGAYPAMKERTEE